MGQFLSASLIEELHPGEMICGTGADIIFMFPVMRQIMAWIGTHPAKRSNITKIFKKGYQCAVIPGGIAEMYLVSESNEAVYLKSRKSTIKVAIQEGADIIPVFFFGNTRILKLGGDNKKGSTSWLSQISRKLRASIIFFYGRHGLPVPYRHPLHMAAGDIVEVKQNDNPSDDYIQEILNQVEKSVVELYETKKPSWENRPLVIT
eukprot:gene4283-6070_t